MYIYMYIYMYILYMYIYMYIYVYIYVDMYVLYLLYLRNFQLIPIPPRALRLTRRVRSKIPGRSAVVQTSGPQIRKWRSA